MRKVIALEFVSLDGVIQAPGGPEEDTSGGFRFGGWTVPFSDNALGEIMSRQMAGPADLLLGRKTFEIFASYWPEHAEGWPGINEMTKYVASKTLSSHGWKNSVFLTGDVASEVGKLKASGGPDLHVYGSAGLLQTLLKQDLVDQLWLKIYPVTLGRGKRLFGDGAMAASFRLLEGKVLSTGVIVAAYARDGDVKTGSF